MYLCRAKVQIQNHPKLPYPHLFFRFTVIIHFHEYLHHHCSKCKLLIKQFWFTLNILVSIMNLTSLYHFPLFEDLFWTVYSEVADCLSYLMLENILMFLDDLVFILLWAKGFWWLCIEDEFVLACSFEKRVNDLYFS